MAEESELVVAGEVVTTPASSENGVVVDAEPATPRLGFWAAGLAAAAGARARRALALAEPEPEGDQIVNVDAPPGTLGLVFRRDSTVLAKVLETSPLRNKVQVGWTLVSVDGEDVEMLNGWQTSRLLQAQAAAGRKLAFAAPARAADQPGPLGRVAAALSPRGRSGAAVPVVAGDVVAEVMEREAPTAGGAGEAVGAVEFLGLWKRDGQKHRILSSIIDSIKMKGSADPNWEKEQNSFYTFTFQLRVAFGRLVDELVRKQVPSGILAICKWSESHRVDDGYGYTYKTRTMWGISWSAGPDDESYQRLDLVSMQADPHESIRFADFDGAVDVCGVAKASLPPPVHNGPKHRVYAVYRVTLPRGGLARGKRAGRPPPPAPEDLYTGPRSDGLLSTGEISGEYSAACVWDDWDKGTGVCGPACCRSKIVVPLGRDAIETLDSWVCCVPPLCTGPRANGGVLTRNPQDPNPPPLTFSADGRFSGGYKKRPHSRKRAFRKVETKELAGEWCGFYYCGWCGPLLPLSCLYWTTKKALDEDRYAESGLRCGLCPPCTISDTRVRVYYDVGGGRSYPTNEFVPEDETAFCPCGCIELGIYYRSSGCVVRDWFVAMRSASPVFSSVPYEYLRGDF
jgi:hypothetical protein